MDGITLKQRISIRCGLLWDRFKTKVERSIYNSSSAKRAREIERHFARKNAFFRTNVLMIEVAYKGDIYALWYREMFDVLEARRKAREPKTGFNLSIS